MRHIWVTPFKLIIHMNNICITFILLYFDIFGKYVFKSFPFEKQCNCIYNVQSILKMLLKFKTMLIFSLTNMCFNLKV